VGRSGTGPAVGVEEVDANPRISLNEPFVTAPLASPPRSARRASRQDVGPVRLAFVERQGDGHLWFDRIAFRSGQCNPFAWPAIGVCKQELDRAYRYMSVLIVHQWCPCAFLVARYRAQGFASSSIRFIVALTSSSTKTPHRAVQNFDRAGGGGGSVGG